MTVSSSRKRGPITTDGYDWASCFRERLISSASLRTEAMGPRFRGDDSGVNYFAPAFCAYSQDCCDSGTVRLADSIALALAAVPSRIRPAIPWVMPARRNRL